MNFDPEIRAHLEAKYGNLLYRCWATDYGCESFIVQWSDDGGKSRLTSDEFNRTTWRNFIDVLSVSRVQAYLRDIRSDWRQANATTPTP